MSRRVLASAFLVAGLSLPLSGCFLFPNYNTPMIGGDDVRMDAPGESSFRSSGERGEVYTMVQETASETNDWVSETVEEIAAIIAVLNEYPEDRRDGSWRVYGPYDDEDGRDLSWIVRIDGDDGDAASFEILVGHRDARGDGDMDALLWGDIAVAGSARNGGFAIDFEAIERHPEMKEDEDDETVFGGQILVSFARDVDTEFKYVEMDFDGFIVDAPDETIDFGEESYLYDRDDDGAGQFHLAAWGSFEEDDLSGPEQERMQIDLRWTPQEAGRARGKIEQIDGAGDLAFGDLEVHECFDSRGDLTWREINREYAEQLPGYNLGDESTCLFEERQLALSPTRD